MTEMIDELLADARDHMAKSVEATRNKFNTVRTGRASPQLLDRVTVDYYGSPTPLKQLATLHAPEARLLTIQPFDPSSMKSIERDGESLLELGESAHYCSMISFDFLSAMSAILSS